MLIIVSNYLSILSREVILIRILSDNVIYEMIVILL